ncbi:MAG TPA: AbrB/MazE/SpoVT family DNA-binding domain-containing protein [Thermoplasmata archaeon]
MLAKAKKWGNSIGLIVPADVVRMEGIRPGDVVDVQIRKRIPSLEELSGTVKLRHNLRDLLREMEEGWDDI